MALSPTINVIKYVNISQSFSAAVKIPFNSAADVCVLSKNVESNHNNHIINSTVDNFFLLHTFTVGCRHNVGNI